MALPRSVQENAKRANEFIQQRGNPGEPPADPQQMSQPRVQDDPSPPTPPAAEETRVQPDAAGVEHDWKKRYEGLQRSHQASVAEQKQERSRYAQERAELLERIEAMEKRMAERPAPTENDFSYLTQDDIDLLGEHNLPIVQKVAQHIAQSMVAEDRRQRELIEQKRQAEAERERSAHEHKSTFQSRLREAVKDFDRIDVDPKFEAFMKEPDELTGVPRSELLARAFSVNDVGRAAAFYQEYVATRQGRDPRDNMVHPNAQGAAAPKPGESLGRKIWSNAEVAHFYREVRPGMLKKDPAQAQRIEEDIFAARREGRYR